MKHHPTPNNNLAPTQTTIPLTPEDLDDPEKLILVVQKYFATAFPNERRVGCPAPGVIQAARADQPPGDELRAHLFRCSECFNEYSAAIRDHRRRRDCRENEKSETANRDLRLAATRRATR